VVTEADRPAPAAQNRTHDFHACPRDHARRPRQPLLGPWARWHSLRHSERDTPAIGIHAHAGWTMGTTPPWAAHSGPLPGPWHGSNAPSCPPRSPPGLPLSV